MIKLICIDMDGTLLDSDHKISERNKNALKKAVEKGVKIAITTGRLYASAKYYADLLGIKVTVIAYNGGFIREKDEDKIIYKSVFTHEQLMSIYNTVHKYNLNSFFYLPNTLISDREVPDSHVYKQMNKTLNKTEDKVEFIEKANYKECFNKYEGQIIKAICIEEDNEKREVAKNELIEVGGLEVVSSWSNNFEVMPKGTNKGKGVEILAKILGIKQDEIMCLGDSENDLSMIKYAGLGVAMGNAIDLLKEEAEYITDSNEDSGVGKAIEKFVLND